MGWFRILKWVLQLFLTVLLLYISINKLDLSELSGIYYRINKILIIPVILFLFLDIYLNSYRIKRLYRLYDIETGIFRIFMIRFYSLFFTLIFPFLGDVYKVQAFKSAYGAGYGKNTFVVILDKLIHVYGLIIIVLLFLSFNILNIGIRLDPYIWGLFLLVTITLIVFNRPEFVGSLIKGLGKLSKYFLRTGFQYVKRANYFSEILLNTLISVFRHVIIGFLHIIIAFAVFQNFKFNIWSFLLIIFLIMLAQIIPLSVGGIGLREFIAVSVFPMIGISVESAFMIAFIISSIIILQGIGGGMTYLAVQLIKIRR